MKFKLKWAFWGTGIAIIIILIVFAFVPDPIPVDMSTVTKAPFAVTVEDDGETRVRDVYVVSAPLPGRMLRIDHKVGDEVTANETLLARILPTDPDFLDVRTRSELQSALEAAQAARSLAEAEVSRAEAEVKFATNEFERAQKLFPKGAISKAALDRAERQLRTDEAALKTAQANLHIKEHELDSARAALIGPNAERDNKEGLSGTDKESCCFDVRSPIDGKILTIRTESEGVVSAGTPLLEIGDPRDMEIVTDLLSSDAVRIRPGDAVDILRWGGPGILHGAIDRIEPYAFTKISSLGIEEQRVNVIIRLKDDYEKWKRLGHGYRVEVRIYLWQQEDILQVPLAALFRQGKDWAVFVDKGRRARLTVVEVGRMNLTAAQITGGLEEGNRVVLHPSDRVSNGTRIVARKQ